MTAPFKPPHSQVGSTQLFFQLPSLSTAAASQRSGTTTTKVPVNYPSFIVTPIFCPVSIDLGNNITLRGRSHLHILTWLSLTGCVNNRLYKTMDIAIKTSLVGLWILVLKPLIVAVSTYQSFLASLFVRCLGFHANFCFFSGAPQFSQEAGEKLNKVY